MKRKRICRTGKPTAMFNPSLYWCRGVQSNNPKSRYYQSKLFQIFAVREIAATLLDRKSPVIINCNNPGMARTDFTKSLPVGPRAMIGVMMAMWGRTPEESGRVLVHSVNAGSNTHGMFMTNCDET